MGLLTPAITPRGKCSTIRYGPYTQHTPHILAETKLACNAQDNIIPANPPFRGSAPAFHKTARILPFRPQDLPIPTPRRDYNDDVDLQHFSSASRSYADKQRKGLQEEHLDSLDMADHLDQALSAPFFLSLPTPLPHSLQSALDYASSTNPQTIISFWEEQLQALETMVSDARLTDLEWNRLIPGRIRPAAGKLRLAALASLTQQHNLGGPLWLQQFLFGFTLTGTLSQR